MTLEFVSSVGTAPQWKQKRNAFAVNKWKRFAILIFRVYLSWVKQKFYRNYRSSRTEVFCRKGVFTNFAKFLRTSFLTEHLRWLLLELTQWSLSPFAFVTRSGFRILAICKDGALWTVANVYKLWSFVGKYSILYFARVLGAASWKTVLQYDYFRQKRFWNKVFSFRQNIL